QAEVDEFRRFMATPEYAAEERDYKVALHKVMAELLSPQTVLSRPFPELLTAFFDGHLDLTQLSLDADARSEVQAAFPGGVKNAFVNLCGGGFGLHSFSSIPGAIRDGLGGDIRVAFLLLTDQRL